MSTENLLWKSKPSQYFNIARFIFFLSLFSILYFTIPANILNIQFNNIPFIKYLFFVVFLSIIFFFIYGFIYIFCLKYELTNERLLIYSGIFSIQREEIELYRIRDYQLESPFFLRIFSLYNIKLLTSDLTSKNPVLYAIKDGKYICDLIRTNVEHERVSKGIRDINFNNF